MLLTGASESEFNARDSHVVCCVLMVDPGSHGVESVVTLGHVGGPVPVRLLVDSDPLVGLVAIEPHRVESGVISSAGLAK